LNLEYVGEFNGRKIFKDEFGFLYERRGEIYDTIYDVRVYYHFNLSIPKELARSRSPYYYRGDD